jgi:hypothetical protein
VFSSDDVEDGTGHLVLSDAERFSNIRAWCVAFGEPGFVADAFAHWLVDDVYVAATTEEDWETILDSFYNEITDIDVSAHYYYRAHRELRGSNWQYPDHIPALDERFTVARAEITARLHRVGQD